MNCVNPGNSVRDTCSGNMFVRRYNSKRPFIICNLLPVQSIKYFTEVMGKNL